MLKEGENFKFKNSCGKVAGRRGMLFRISNKVVNREKSQMATSGKKVMRRIDIIVVIKI